MAGPGPRPHLPVRHAGHRLSGAVGVLPAVSFVPRPPAGVGAQPRFHAHGPPRLSSAPHLRPPSPGRFPPSSRLLVRPCASLTPACCLPWPARSSFTRVLSPARPASGPELVSPRLAALLVASGPPRMLPLPAEFSPPRAGAAKQVCEREAVKRHGPGSAPWRPVSLGAARAAGQPVCPARLASGAFLLPAKPSRPKPLSESCAGLRLPSPLRSTATEPQATRNKTANSQKENCCCSREG